MANVAASSSAGTLDVPSLVSQLMTVERQPIDKLNTQVSSYQTKISSLGTIKGLVSGLQTSLQSLTSSLQGYSATSSDTSIFTASATSTATSGTYSLAVANLAQAQNLAAVGQASTTATINAGTSTTVTFDFGTTVGAVFTPNGSGAKTVTIDGTNNTLQGIRDAINAAGIGVTATIVNDGSASPYRLVISSNSSGASNSLKITTNGAGNGVDALLAYDPAGTKNLTQTVAAQDASFTLNGIPMTSTTNTVANAIQGVSLTLNNKTVTPATLTVAHDTSAISTAAASFVDAYNAMYNQMKTRSAYGTSSAAGGNLSGDGTVRQMMDQLRSIFMTGATGGTLTSLSQVGIATQTDGTLKLDSSTLKSAVTANYADVTNLFTSASGYATRLSTWSTSVLSAGGLIDQHITSLNTTITGFTNQISQLERRMLALQALYSKQFSNLNMMLSSMNNTSAYLTQQFTNTTK